MRMKKDEKIHEMALKKKQQMEDAKRGKIPQPTSTNYGGFVGVHNLTSAGSIQLNILTCNFKLETNFWAIDLFRDNQPTLFH